MSKRRKLGEKDGEEEMKEGKETQMEEDYRIRISCVITLIKLFGGEGGTNPSHTHTPVATVSSNVNFISWKALGTRL